MRADREGLRPAELIVKVVRWLERWSTLSLELLMLAVPSREPVAALPHFAAARAVSW
jgi:hypothetical protein